MKTIRSEKRTNKIISVINFRQKSLHVVLENIHDPHNVSAIFRTCDSVGVGRVSLVYNIEPFPKIGKKSSASAYKWVEREKYKNIKDCALLLKKDGFKVLVSSITDSSKSIYDFDLTKKTAIVFGNEHRGVSKEAEEIADEKFIIPMFGMVQSLNVSVAAAICLYEASRQRSLKGMYDKSEFSKDELEMKINEWILNK
ncbi:MAG: RNA methyltransferase [Ignavibacteria bacterium GWA2_35_9]|nr:MAG: RNA methyltransferase [Ignavibacteria bacterium GWA2_35_9]OGU47802.1 MAG: RNA methyltransferase [Ignavibacteria bacterium GWB2_36_8]OGU99721.1 MAG: RNA methyltransferase [Ignavibacteria bacterium RIFOXYB2_FULL_36_7]